MTRREIGRPKTFVGDSALALRLNRRTEQQPVPLTSDSIGGLVIAVAVAVAVGMAGTGYQYASVRVATCGL